MIMLKHITCGVNNSQTNKNRASHNAHLSHLISSGKQHNYTLYINYHKWTRNIKNNILLLQDIHMVSEKHGEKKMRTSYYSTHSHAVMIHIPVLRLIFLKGSSHFLKISP